MRTVAPAARVCALLLLLLGGTRSAAAAPAKGSAFKAAPKPTKARPVAKASAKSAVEAPPPAPTSVEVTTASPSPASPLPTVSPPPDPAPLEARAAPTMRTVDSDAPAATSTRWYGWQVVLVNAASLTAASVGWQQQNFALAGVGLGGQILGAPIVHAVHGRWGATFLSLAINTIVPAGGVGVGAAIAATSVSQDVQVAASGTVTDPATYKRVADSVQQAAKTGPLIGYIVGVVLATGVDSLANGFEPTSKEPAKERSFVARLTPQLEAGPSRAYVGVGGTF